MKMYLDQQAERHLLRQLKRPGWVFAVQYRSRDEPELRQLSDFSAVLEKLGKEANKRMKALGFGGCDCGCVPPMLAIVVEHGDRATDAACREFVRQVWGDFVLDQLPAFDAMNHRNRGTPTILLPLGNPTRHKEMLDYFYDLHTPSGATVMARSEPPRRRCPAIPEPSLN